MSLDKPITNSCSDMTLDELASKSNLSPEQIHAIKNPDEAVAVTTELLEQVRDAVVAALQ